MNFDSMALSRVPDNHNLMISTFFFLLFDRCLSSTPPVRWTCLCMPGVVRNGRAGIFPRTCSASYRIVQPPADRYPKSANRISHTLQGLCLFGSVVKLQRTVEVVIG
ncbi:hypothetical protein AVEN_154216-1 [Araneus ventricosus]|uniref:Uncharacterized protein n=1 Tax=Araneus ventricosus TaxID=182803 RepID=A0A4Y2GUS1_ARAVE|nr:hypothetical protein AVEN_154216-1 [Araneus ventricosus]